MFGEVENEPAENCNYAGVRSGYVEIRSGYVLLRFDTVCYGSARLYPCIATAPLPCFGWTAAWTRSCATAGGDALGLDLHGIPSSRRTTSAQREWRASRIGAARLIVNGASLEQFQRDKRQTHAIPEATARYIDFVQKRSRRTRPTRCRPKRRKADNDAARLSRNRRKEKTITSTRRYVGKPRTQELLDAVHNANNM